MAAFLGILHGHASYSLSISSAHAFAMAPGYVEKYARKMKLKAPVRDVKKCILTKLASCLLVPLPKPVRYAVRCGSALSCLSAFPELAGKVDVVLTSPPYLNAQTYAKDNWLRLWLLGYDYKEIAEQYIETGSVDRYTESMRCVFQQLGKLLRKGGKLILVGGIAMLPCGGSNGTKRQTVDATNLLARACGSSGAGFEVKSISDHPVPGSRRYLHSLSKSNGHVRRDRTESVLVAIKI
jgi:DNA modification methylase